MLAAQPRDPRRERRTRSSWRERERRRRSARSAPGRSRATASCSRRPRRSARRAAAPGSSRSLGDRVRYRATALETARTDDERAAPSRGRDPRRRSCAEEPPAEAAGAVRELFDRHYRAWLDRPAARPRQPHARAAAARHGCGGEGRRPAQAAGERGRARRAAAAGPPTTSAGSGASWGSSGRRRGR